MITIAYIALAVMIAVFAFCFGAWFMDEDSKPTDHTKPRNWWHRK